MPRRRASWGRGRRVGIIRVSALWDIPQSTPLHCAATATHSNVHGRHRHDEAARSALVKLLLDRGADPNIVAGNGLTALDIATAAGASGIAALIEQRGGRRAAEL